MARRRALALLVVVAGMGLLGCTSERARGNDTEPEPSIGPGPRASSGEAPAIPAFDFGGVGEGPPDAPPADVPTVDNDPGPSFGARVWAVDEGGRLVSFRHMAPDVVSVKPITGLATGEAALGLDLRPATGQLYVLGSTSRLYAIETSTGAAKAVGDGAPFTPPVVGQAHGFDFDPTADAARVHTDVDQDLRLDPTTGKVAVVDGALAFRPGDVHEGQSPNLVATAYTAASALYGIDSTRNLLVRVPSPSEGLIETVGELGIDVEQTAGFDISPQGAGFAALRSGGETALYLVDLATAATTKLGTVLHPVPLVGIAVEP